MSDTVNKKETIKKKSRNILANAHEMVGKLPKKFREKICYTFNWSEKTYYRKMEDGNEFSPAEIEKIDQTKREFLPELSKETIKV